MVRGPSPGPAPAAQARASNSRLTRSSWRTWPHRKLRRKAPRACPREGGGVDGALTMQSLVPVVPPVRNTSASSMQSPQPARRPPGSAFCLQCSPAPAHLRDQRGCRRVHADPGAERGSPEGAAQHWPPGGDRRRRCGCGRGGCVVASIGCSFFWGRSSVSKTIIPEAQEHFLVSSGPRYTPSFGGLELRTIKLSLTNGPSIDPSGAPPWKHSSTVGH